MSEQQVMGVTADAAGPAVPSGPEPAAQSQPEALVPNARKTRKARWARFDELVKCNQAENHPPAFLQEITVGGLWSVQYLVPASKTAKFSKLHRCLNDPPDSIDYEAYYNGWPGDHRGWMRFQSAEEARDFYKFATGLMSFEDYRARDKGAPSWVRIDLDANGDFVPASGTEAGTGETACGLDAQHDGPVPKADAQAPGPQS